MELIKQNALKRYGKNNDRMLTKYTELASRLYFSLCF